MSAATQNAVPPKNSHARLENQRSNYFTSTLLPQGSDAQNLLEFLWQRSSSATMDPFSILVGSLALTEAANKVAGKLMDTYQDFKSAPEEMVEIADQVTFCSGLVDVFANSVDTTGLKFPPKFREDVTTLVDKCNSILTDIEGMIPEGTRDLDRSDYVQRLKYAFGDKKANGELQDKLKKVQHMFMFMTTCWMYQVPSMQHHQQQQVTSSAIPVGSLRGTMEHVPVQITMNNGNGESQAVIYEATLTLNPKQPPPTTSRPGLPRSKSSLTDNARTKTNAKESLKNMRRSPYFSTNLLRRVRPVVTTESDGSGRRADRHRTSYSKNYEEIDKKRERYREDSDHRLREETSVETKSREEASRDVDEIINDWFSIEHSYSPASTSSPMPSPAAQPDSSRSTPYQYRPPLEKSSVKSPRSPLRIVTDIPAPKTPPGVMYSRDWRCDGCNRKTSSPVPSYAEETNDMSAESVQISTSAPGVMRAYNTRIPAQVLYFALIDCVQASTSRGEDGCDKPLFELSA
ncbi:hypothetical protein BP5796_02181 [Coleophoma crateriformis]|uniref:Fungal N-terminal domain-containing protein n=1 Tax=Coleophoma crateriformis TaxID=565419 RepID=A0A3D8SXI3_9HELO|nr:hypothetical protein BP5796_02181 [Coleophoma crateriformis]